MRSEDELREALPLVIPSLVKSLDSTSQDEIRRALSLLERLAKHSE